MKADKCTEMEKRYMSWSTEDLIKATTVEKADYEPDSIIFMSKELQRRGVSSDEVNVRQADVEQKIKSEDQKLSGLGGFLLLFLIIFIFNLILAFVQGFSILANASTQLNVLSLSLSIPQFIIGVYGVYIFFLLVRKKYNAPSHTIRWLILSAAVSFLSGILLFYISGKLEFSIISPFVFALIWLTYFTNSKRVAITYGVK